MGTTFLAPSGGKADLPLPGVTQSLALWARIFTPHYVRDRYNRRSQKIRHHKWKCVWSPRVGRDEQAQADVSRGTGDRKGAAISRIRTTEQMAGYDCSQGESGERQQRQQIDFEDQTEASYHSRQCSQNHCSASDLQQRIADPLGQGRRR